MKNTVLHLSQAAGGVDIYLKLLLSHADKERYRHILIGASTFVEEEYQGLVDHFEYFDIARTMNPIVTWREVVAFKKILRKHHPDILYCHSTFAGAIGRLAALGTAIKVIYNPHGWVFNMRISPIVQHGMAFMEHLLAYMTDRIVCISDFEKSQVKRYHIADLDKVQVIYNGIDIRVVDEQLKVHETIPEIPNGSFVVGMTGRIEETKAPDMFVRMAAEVKRHIPEAFFVITGDGLIRSTIEALFDEMGLKGSYFITGWTSTPIRYVVKYDVGVLLSRWEGFGLAAAEYMAAGKPVVCTRAGGLPNLVEEDVDGILVDVDDYQAAADAIIRLHDDHTLASRLGAHGYQKTRERFDIHRVISETEQLFDSLMINSN